MDYLVLTPAQLSVVLRSHRKSKNLTQKDAAALVGLLPKTISSLESNSERSSLESFF
ncbi:MAG: helix-turn-helix domain-containing protein [Spirochaetales bacterium]|nr:helix-turn-helix domain-containing protein [Spirochaetales bacterium]